MQLGRTNSRIPGTKFNEWKVVETTVTNVEAFGCKNSCSPASWRAWAAEIAWMPRNSLVKPRIALGRSEDGSNSDMDAKTHNSWMILSKLMTAKRRDAIAAPEMRERATILKREAVFETVAGERSEGSGKAVGMAAVEKSSGFAFCYKSRGGQA
jgi:hypothetical protein